jgi:hypothetical protein
MRTKPNFSKKDSPEGQTRNNDTWGCTWLALLIAVGYIVSSAVARVNSHTGSWLDQVICYGTLISIVTTFIVGDWAQKREKKKLHEAQQEWKRGCKSAEVAIVNRYGYDGGSYEDEYGIPHTTRPNYHLNIELGADQKAISPNQTTVQVNVYSNVFQKLEKRDTVRIYYEPESPLEFLLEEEIE